MSDVPTKALRCPSCSSPLDPALADPDVVTCGACGAVLDVSSSAEAALLTTLKPQFFSPASFIKLGLIGTFNGKKYQVIGRICYNCRIREWDPEDSAYYNEVWKFDQWVLVSEDKKYKYLCEDIEGYTIEESFVPTNPRMPAPTDTHLTLDKDHRPQRILEFGNAEIAHFEGEFTWVPKLGEVTESAEYQLGIVTYSVEWRRKPDSEEIEEVEFFQSTSIDRIELARAFDLREIIEEEERKKELERHYRKWSAAFFGAAAVCCVLFLYSCAHDGKKIADMQVNFQDIPEQGLTHKPIELKREGSVHLLKLTTKIQDNSWAWGGVELLDKSQQVVNAFERDFWRESGRDSDGAWSESDLKQTSYFRLDNPGTYYPRFFVDKGSASSGSLRLQIYEGVILSRYYFFACFLSLGLGYSIRRFKTLNPLYAVIGVVILGYLVLEMLPDDD